MLTKLWRNRWTDEWVSAYVRARERERDEWGGMDEWSSSPPPPWASEQGNPGKEAGGEGREAAIFEGAKH
jgi:hypothetical protein